MNSQTKAMQRRLLLVEDESGLMLTLSDLLGSEGYLVEGCADAESAETKLGKSDYDLILLDVMLPGKSGLEFLRALRAGGNQVPVLMLTARSSTPDRVVGLKLGADDYLPKPFDSLELLARIEALLRRSEQSARQVAAPLAFGSIRINPERSEATRDGEVLPLTLQEYRLLTYMVGHPGKTLSRDRLLEEVWGYDSDAASRTIDVHVSSLRQKVETNPAHPAHIVTVRGLGYRFEP